MKDYLIWLSSGSCIEGSMEDSEAQKLKEIFKEKFHCQGISEFKDTDGDLLVDMAKVEAVSINKATGKDKLGFKTETP